ncbi:MAG: TldD/PmbA family protein, partial [Myxococcales bacterium]|nr:TldD/PmbA family protein [Myxococcales bacterium]
MSRGATVAESSVREGAHLSVKVRMGEPELVEEAGSRSLGLRVMQGQKVAVTHTNDLSKAGIARLVDDALELVRLSEPDPFAGPPDPSLLSKASEHKDLDLFDADMSALDAGEAIARAKRAEKAAFDADPRITNSEGATYSRIAGGGVLVTSGGFVGSSRGTYASLVVRPVVDDEGGKKRTGYHWSARRHLRELDAPEVVGKEAAARTLRKLGARKVETQEAPVVFDPDAARSIVGTFAGCIMGSSIWRKSSYLVDREGTRVASDAVTMVDDPWVARGPGSRAFDGEGLLSRKNVVVENGVLRTYLVDTYSGKKLSKASTASAARGSSGGVSPSTSNFILSAGTTPPEEIIRSTKRGLYVTEMMGFGFNAVTGDFSRGASGFLIEDGALGHAVSEVTISLNLDQLLQRIDG